MPVLVGRGGDVLLAIQLQPRASRTELVGLHGDALKIRVAAPPAGGAANEALRALLADHLGLPLSRIQIQRGATSRAKVVRLQGIAPAEVTARLNLPTP